MGIELVLTRIIDVSLQHSHREEIRRGGELLGCKLFLGPLPEGERGVRWIVGLVNDSPGLISGLMELDSKQYGEWPVGERVMVMERRKKWDGDKFLGKEYRLVPVTEEALEVAQEILGAEQETIV